MSSSRPPRKKRGLRGFLRHGLDKITGKSDLPQTPESASHQSLPVSASIESSHQQESKAPTNDGHLTVFGQSAAEGRSASAPDLSTDNGVTSAPAATQAACTDIGDTVTSRETTRSSVWTTLETALRALHHASKGFPLLHTTMDTLISCLDLFESASKHRQEYDRMASDLEDQISQLNRHLSSSNSTALTDCVTNVIKSLQIEVGYVGERRKQGTAKRVIRVNENEEDLIQCFQRVLDIFRRLQVDASLSTWCIANEILANTRLEALMPAKSARYNAILPADIVRRTCTERTRTDILSGLDDWSYDPTKPKVYWMNGMAGTGKTTIACSLSEALIKRKQLGASFFCTRTLPDCRDAGRIVPTIAYQLARYSRPFQAALCKVLENDPDIRTQQIPVQLERMLKEPLMEVQDAMPNNVVVVVDALDECDDANQVTVFLTELFRCAPDLPLKLFVTSRPEPGISESILLQSGQDRDILYLHEIESSLVQADIELYLKEELSFISPSDLEIKQLAELAGNLFIYASTAVRYIRPTKLNRAVKPKKRLQDVISHSPESTKQHAELDALYTTILQGALGEDVLEAQETEEGLTVLWTAVLVREPVSVECLASLTALDATEAHTILQALHSVLQISRDGELVSTLHASFPDFIKAANRSQRFYCNDDIMCFLAKRCFSLMNSGLKFNICGLESSFVLDESIHDLSARIETHIPQALSYVCRYWGDHLSAISFIGDLGAMLEDFLAHQLLSWMEVLNLTRSGMIGIALLYRVQQWILSQGTSPYSTRLLSDARLFVAAFVQNTVASSTPHIYVSALAFCHRSSLIYTLYQGRMQGLVNMRGTALENRPANDAKWSTGVQIRSVSASPVGNLIAFGGQDDQSQGMIGAIDYHTGAYSLPVFKGHYEPVTSVAFSPDGSRLASASDDQTICVWNVSNGKRSWGPCGGHADVVSSVTFSPDGTLLASGSGDKTICVWTSRDGKPAMGPFEGHTDFVSCISFSPDGTRIVSGSHDFTIRVWSIPDQSCVAGPFTVDDSYWVRAVAFSSDQLRVAVGFNSGLSLWDIQKGEKVFDFGQGHEDRTVSVAFSPDYTCVVSSSDTSGMICTWDAQTGKLVSEVDAHTEDVNCVAFSSQGTCMLSGSSDTTICVWPTNGLNKNIDAPQGVPSPICCIAFSVDGTRFASGSDDGSVCVWAIHDGRLTIGPLKGHGKDIVAVSFSPDQSHIVSVARDGSLFTWNAQNGSVVSGPVQGPVTGEVASIAISPDATRVVSGFESGAMCVWGADDGKVVVDSFEGHSERINSLAFSPDGTRIVSGSGDNTVCVWNAHDGTRIAGPFTAHTDWVRSVSFSPDGLRIASGSDDKTICVHNLEDGKLVASPFKGHDDWVMSVAFSPDGTLIASGSTDGEVRVWNAHSGEQVAGPFTGAWNSISSVAFSPDGRHIVCCRKDRSIRFIPISPPSASASVPALDGELKVDESGWLVNEQGQHLLWVPPHIRPFFPSVREALVISSDGSIQVDYSGMLIGDEWSKCHAG